MLRHCFAQMDVRQVGSTTYITLAVVLIAVLASCGLFVATERKTPGFLQATAEVERSLAGAFGVEVRSTIENFASRWSSLDAHLDPSIQSELATGPYLEYYGLARKGTALYEEPFWLITRSAIVVSFRVLEYSAGRFKAVGCVVKLTDETDTAGVFRKSLPAYESCGVYVFVREENTWKLAGFFNTADPRDWDYAPDWLKEIIGELPDN